MEALVIIGLVALAIWIPFMYTIICQTIKYHHKMYRN